MDQINEPAWAGISYVIGSATHIMPLHEDDRHHRMDMDCPCRPDSVDLFGEHALEPMRVLITHYPATTSL